MVVSPGFEERSRWGLEEEESRPRGKGKLEWDAHPAEPLS